MQTSIRQSVRQKSTEYSAVYWGMEFEKWNSRQMICSKQILTRDLSEENATGPGNLSYSEIVFLSEKIMKPINKWGNAIDQ